MPTKPMAFVRADAHLPDPRHGRNRAPEPSPGPPRGPDTRHTAEDEALFRANGIPEILWPFLVPRPPDPSLIGVTEAARRLGVSRSTVHSWIKKGKLLGWPALRRGTIIFADQILGPRKVVPAIAEVIEIIGSPELVWVFLAHDWPFANDVSRPIDKLRAGKVDEVLAVAPGFGSVVT